MDLGCYPLGLTLQLLGAEPTSVEAEAVLTARGVDESLTARLGFAGGVEVELSASMGKGLAFDASLRVIGETGEIRYWNPVVPHLGGRLTVMSGDAVRDLPVPRISSYTYQLEAVLGALESGQALPTEGEAILRQQRAGAGFHQAAANPTDACART
jgi:predicted dehydrogenase